MTVDTALRQIFTVFFSREKGGGDGKEAVGGGGVRGALRLPAPGRSFLGGAQRARAVMDEFLCRGFIGRLEDVSGLHGRSFSSKYAMMPYRMERCRFL